MHPRTPLAFLAARALCWLMVNLLSPSTPRSLSAELLSSRSAPACTGAWGCSSPGARPCTCPCWTSSGSSAPNSRACPGHAEWQHNLAVYPPLLPVLCLRQTCWGYTLFLHPGHWWRSWTRQVEQEVEPLPNPPLNHVTKHHVYKSFNTSQAGDSATSLGSLFQCLITLLVKEFFLMPNLNLHWCNFRLFPLILSLVTWEKSLTPKMKQLLDSGIRLQFSQLHRPPDRRSADRGSLDGSTSLCAGSCAWRREKGEHTYMAMQWGMCSKEPQVWSILLPSAGPQLRSSYSDGPEVPQWGWDHNTTGNGSTCFWCMQWENCWAAGRFSDSGEGGLLWT